MFVYPKVLWLAIVAAIGLAFSAQIMKAGAQTKMAFLNTRNLYDTINDPGVQDGEYTPQGKMKWDRERYNEKIIRLAKVIGGINADFIGLCEVENMNVLKDLNSKLGGVYKIIHYDSRDARGIDVCAMYKEAKVKVIGSELIDLDTMSRQVLRVQAVINDDPVAIYCCHLPSKRGGNKAALKRNILLDRLEKCVWKESTEVIVMGDMNQDPITVRGMENLAIPLYKKGLGTYCYRGVWSMLDQILVSAGLIKKTGEMKIFNNDKSGIFINANYDPAVGSDHLAVCFILH